jgi:hypothetical protein
MDLMENENIKKGYKTQRHREQGDLVSLLIKIKRNSETDSKLIS